MELRNGVKHTESPHTPEHTKRLSFKADIPSDTEDDIYKQRSVSEQGSSEDACEPGVTWDNHIEFILSCVGYAVGLGNIWRFPYLCMQNGGGAFLIPYFVSLVFCGVPLFFLEVSLGQFSGLSPLEVWNVCPLFKGLGYGMVIVSGIICIYYNVVIAWVVYYLIRSFTKKLPWSDCNNDWNTPMCVVRESVIGGDGNNSTSTMAFLQTHTNVSIAPSPTEGNYWGPSVSQMAESKLFSNLTLNTSVQWKSPAEEFWQHEVLEMTGGIDDMGGINWPVFGCFMLSWLVVFLCLFKGVESSGKVVYVTATAPYVLLTILLVRGATLPGAVDGIKFYLIPDWGKLLHFKVWAVALLQVFYSLGPAWGGLIAMSSYNRFNNNVVRDAILVPLINGGTSFYGGFVIFSVIGFIAHETGRPIKHFAKSGPGLAFIAYPEALAELPISPLWAVFFFLMLFTLGLDSQFATFETVTSSFFDLIPKKLRRHKLPLTAMLCAIEALLGIVCCTKAGVYFFQVLDWYAAAFSAGVYFFQILDWYAAAFSVIFIALIECVSLSWIYGHERLYYDIELMIGRRPSVFWKICWCFITPAMLVVSIIYSMVAMSEPTVGDYVYPRWAIAFGWTVAMTSIIPIPLFFIKTLLEQKGSLMQRLRSGMKPTARWGPAHPQYRARYKYLHNTDSAGNQSNNIGNQSNNKGNQSNKKQSSDETGEKKSMLLS